MDLGLLHDVLQELSDLSQQLQKQTMTLIKTEKCVKRTIRILTSYKDVPGEKVNGQSMPKQV